MSTFLWIAFGVASYIVCFLCWIVGAALAGTEEILDDLSSNVGTILLLFLVGTVAGIYARASAFANAWIVLGGLAAIHTAIGVITALGTRLFTLPVFGPETVTNPIYKNPSLILFWILPLSLLGVWLLSQPCVIRPGADLRGCDFSGRDLTEFKFSERGDVADLSQANLSGVGLEDTRLYKVCFSQANLSDANLSGADLTRADLSGADLSYARLTDADMRSATLARVKLGEADLTGADLSGADLTGADLSGADLSYAKLTDADMRSATLARVKLGEADLTGANLRGANLRLPDLSGADLTGANLNAAMLVAVDLSDTGGVTPKLLAGVDHDGGFLPKSTQRKLRLVCQGEGISQTAVYNGESGLHPLGTVVILARTTELLWPQSLPPHWYAFNLESAELVVCVSQTDRVIQTCDYFGRDGKLRQVERILRVETILLKETRTGRTVASTIEEGPSPWECPSETVFNEDDTLQHWYGRSVGVSTMKNWLAEYVEPSK